MKRTYAISLCINVLLCVFGMYFAGKRYLFQQTLPPPTVAYFENYNQARKKIQDSLIITEDDYVFVGTSLTEGFPLNEYFPNIPIKNRGIGGNEISAILDRIGPYIAANPAGLYLEMGTNDVLHKLPQDTILRRYGMVLNMAASLRGRVYIQNIPPLASIYATENKLIDSLNIQLRKIAAAYGATYIDLNTRLRRDGAMCSSNSYDGIHLTLEGYEQWYSALAPYVFPPINSHIRSPE